MQLTIANAFPSEVGESGVDASPLGLRVIFLPDLAEGALKRSGIKRGMRVLDLGCGDGNVSLSIAKLIGPSGLVVGVDRSAQAIDVAEKQATVAAYCYWTRFVTADPNTFVSRERFDAVVARSAQFRQRGNATLLRLSASVRPNGLVVVVSGTSAT